MLHIFIIIFYLLYEIEHEVLINLIINFITASIKFVLDLLYGYILWMQICYDKINVFNYFFIFSLKSYKMFYNSFSKQFWKLFHKKFSKLLSYYSELMLSKYLVFKGTFGWNIKEYKNIKE